MNSLSPIDQEYGLNAPPVKAPIPEQKMFRAFYASAPSALGATFPAQDATNLLGVAPEWWIVRVLCSAAQAITITRQNGDDITLNVAANVAQQLAIPGISAWIRVSFASSLGSTVTAFAVNGYSPQDILL